MKSKFLIWTIGAVALCLMSACANGDVQRVQKAEELLTVNRDSAMAILREVVRPDQLPEESKALYWFCVADIRANTMQSLSEDSMICWAAQYFRNRWLQDGEYEDYMMKAGMEEAFYWWWNDNKEKAQQVLQRQQQYAAEIAEKKGEHIWEVILLRISAELAMRDYDYERVRDYTEALIRLGDGKAIHLDEVVRVYNGMAITYFYLGEYDKMEECFEKAIAQTSDSAFIVNLVRRNYADLLGEIGQTDRAIRMHEELAAIYRKGESWLLVESLYSLSRLWLNKGDKQRADRYMREAEELFETYRATISSPSAEAGLLAHRQVLNYALHGHYQMMPLATYNTQWQDKDYIRYRVAEAKERSMSDLREQVLRQQLAKQRQTILIVGLVCVVLGLCMLFVYLYRRRQRLLLEKEEEIETLKGIINKGLSDKVPSDQVPSTKEADGNVRKLMLQQLGVIKTIAGTPTEANQQLLARLMALNETTADALIDWQSIYQTIDLVYDGFYTRLVEKYGDKGLSEKGQSDQVPSTKEGGPLLNEKEIQLCCLLKADFSTKEINMLTRQSLQTIYQRKTQIRQKLNLAEAEDIAMAIL
ncbi:MAG: tetratricopeptide repeat protein [Paludibacteraceae bacterium]|nr:tetratricopeptide repeat protein [Paludibacteraceae bacterium]